MSDTDLILKLFLQLVVILATCRLFGWIGKKLLGQTQVVMEMIAGVCLGPSLFGLIWPEGQQALFPQRLPLLDAVGAPLLDASGAAISVRHPSMQILFVVAQVAIALYMFTVGLHLNLDIIKKHGKSAQLISFSGILGPVILGMLASILLFQRGDMFEPKVTLPVAMMFLGAAMCVTAFPVLSRIINEKKISKTKIGTLTLASGATDDVVAWIVLAVVMTVLRDKLDIAMVAILGGILFVALVLTIGRRFFNWMGKRVEADGHVNQTNFAIMLLILVMSAYYTDSIGIYAVFGSFLLGVIVPRGIFADGLYAKIEPLTTSLLIPLFFVYSGLNCKINLLNTPTLWLLTLLVILTATVGKALCCSLAAKASGMNWRESWAVGTLMNARGLMELIMLNIGLQEGVITPTLYTMMVLMAIVTTVMASPIFELFYKRLKVLENAEHSDAKVLLA